MALSFTVFEIFDFEKYLDIENQVRGHPRSSKLVLFDSLHAVSY